MTDIGTYQRVADEYRERNGDREGVRDMVETFLAAVDDATGGSPGRIVDVGCGTGWESATFTTAGHAVVAVDLTLAFLRLAREEAPAADVARMDMRRLGPATDVVDGLWAYAWFIHVPREDAPGTLAEFRRVLRPVGCSASR